MLDLGSLKKNHTTFVGMIFVLSPSRSKVFVFVFFAEERMVADGNWQRMVEGENGRESERINGRGQKE